MTGNGHARPQRPVLSTALLAMATVIGAIIVVGWIAGNGNGPEGATPSLRVETTVVELQDSYFVQRRFVGQVAARRRAVLGFELAGRVAAIAADDGDQVRAGDPVADLDTERLEARRAEIAAARNEAAADRNLQASTFERVERAHGDGAVSDQQRDEARQALDAAAARLERLEAQIASIDVDLSKSVIRAPYDGRIVQRTADPGDVVSAGQPVLRLLEDRQLEARIGVTAEQAEGLETGQARNLTIAGRSVPSRLRAILPERDGRTRTVDLVFDLEEAAPAGLRTGDLAVLTLEEEIGGAGFWLPRGALTAGSRGLWAAYLVRRSDAESGTVYRIARVNLELLHGTEDRVFVRGPVTAGDRIVRSGLHRLAPGMTVQPGAGQEVARG